MLAFRIWHGSQQTLHTILSKNGQQMHGSAWRGGVRMDVGVVAAEVGEERGQSGQRVSA